MSFFLFYYTFTINQQYLQTNCFVLHASFYKRKKKQVLYITYKELGRKKCIIVRQKQTDTVSIFIT